MPREVLSELQNVVLLAMREAPLATKVAYFRSLLDAGRQLWQQPFVLDLHGMPSELVDVLVAVSILEIFEREARDADLVLITGRRPHEVPSFFAC